MFQKNAKHLSNDSSHDIHRTPLLGNGAYFGHWGSSFQETLWAVSMIKKVSGTHFPCLRNSCLNTKVSGTQFRWIRFLFKSQELLFKSKSHTYASKNVDFLWLFLSLEYGRGYKKILKKVTVFLGIQKVGIIWQNFIITN